MTANCQSGAWKAQGGAIINQSDSGSFWMSVSSPSPGLWTVNATGCYATCPDGYAVTGIRTYNGAGCGNGSLVSVPRCTPVR